MQLFGGTTGGLVASAGLGALLGMRHALEPDHLAALSTLLTGERNIRRAAWLGVYWGIGHTLTRLVAGTLLVVLRTEMPPMVADVLAWAVVLMLVFGVVGYVLKKCNYPLAPMVLAIVLGDKAEEAFRQSLLASQGSLGIFVSNPLVSSIMALGLIALFWPLISNAMTRLRPRPAVY